MKIKQYQVDAFSSELFAGNPAAVCILDEWLDEHLLQAIAEENNLSETAFFVQNEKSFSLRWFTPSSEVRLCGHATLATAHVIFEHLGFTERVITFETLSGDLLVEKVGDLFQMDFPAYKLTENEISEALEKGLGIRPIEVLADEDYLAVFDCETTVREITPNMFSLAQLDLRGVIVTAPGNEVDFVSRFFAPKLGIPEDPVTGSAHCALAPYWARKLGKNTLSAMQVSKRGGKLECEVKNDRVILRGKAVTFMDAEIYI